MLEPWIIEKIRQREEKRRRDSDAYVELPLESPQSDKPRPSSDQPGSNRGVVVIDLKRKR